MNAIRVRVPATSANLGPGFDCLGLAVSLHNEMVVRWGSDITQTHVEVSGEGKDELREENNAFLAALWHGLATLGQAPQAVHVALANAIPLARGLGSSAAAIIGGLAAARAIALGPAGAEDRDWLLVEALRFESHPDNLAAAIHGGLTAALVDEGGRARCLRLPLHERVGVAFAVPSIKVSTNEARLALPSDYPRADVVFSSSRAAVLVGALGAGALDWLGEAVRDRVHTPARSHFIPAWPTVQAVAREAGARGVFVSGSGPTVGAFVESGPDAERVAQRMAQAFRAASVEARAYAPSVDRHGVVVTRLQ